MSEKYVIWSNEHRAWWAPEEFGYVRSLTHAGRYSRTRALEICRRALLGSPEGVPNEIMVREDDMSDMHGGPAQ